MREERHKILTKPPVAPSCQPQNARTPKHHTALAQLANRGGYASSVFLLYLTLVLRRLVLLRLGLPLRRLPEALLLPLPMAALLVVLANIERPPQPLALFYLGLGQLVDLVRLETLLRRATAVAVPLHLGQELLAQLVAPVINLLLVDPVSRSLVS